MNGAKPHHNEECLPTLLGRFPAHNTCQKTIRNRYLPFQCLKACTTHSHGNTTIFDRVNITWYHSIYAVTCVYMEAIKYMCTMEPAQPYELLVFCFFHRKERILLLA